jgi:hypothetical protein
MEKQEKKSVSIADIITKIENISLKVNPTLNEYFNGEAAEYFLELRRALKIIDEYGKGEREYDLVTAGKDCIALSAIHANIGTVIGYLQGMASRTEAQRRVVKSEYAIAIKKKRDILNTLGTQVKLTESEIDHAARVLSKDYYDNARDIEIISRMMSNAWYAIGDFVKILNSTCNRAFREAQI